MTRIEREKRVVELMIRLFCKKKEGNLELCESCSKLLSYAHQRLDSCKFGEGKCACKSCAVHCYKPEMRQKIREVMRFSGPLMLLHYPAIAIRHLFEK